ncbi:MAG: hypothetical protein NTV43_13265 [Methylococcales bacterium]|nr:hypothetical protein [Methylococcales bacterium]
MKILSRLFLLLPITLLVLLVLLVFFGISDTPDLPIGWTLTQNDVIRARQILHEGSKAKPDELGTISLSQADLNLATNYLLNRYSKSAAKIEIKNNVLRFTVSMTLPDNRIGRYVNISFRLATEDHNDLPSLTKFKAGKLLLPAKFAALVIDSIIRHTTLNEYYILATRPIKAVAIDHEKITITYHSNPQALAQARNFLTQGSENPNLKLYQDKLAVAIARHDPGWRLSLAELLKPAFALALQRSTLATAIEENKMAIMAVNDYVNGKVGQKRYATFLYKRIDLAQHFIASAAITASVSGQIAQAAGEEKELNDAQGGSGFSFIDLAADKAGTRFGEMATANPDSARKMQKAVSEINDYRDFMPDPTDLPEHMDAAEFKQRYQSVNSPAYQALSQEIDGRIAAMAIYKHQ